MRFRGNERLSILLLSRNSVVIGVVVITIVSFGLGYFIGFKGGDFIKTEEQKGEIVSENHEPPTVDKEEKMALETAPKQPSKQPLEQPIVSPMKPFDAFPEHQLPKEDAFARESSNEQPAASEKPSASVSKEKDKKQPTDEQLTDKIQAEIDAKAKDAKEGKTTAKAKTAQKSPPKASKAAEKSATKKLYTIQFGAFPNREGAEQLQQTLKAKKIKAYILKVENDPYFRVRTGEFKSKKEADRQAIALEKQTGMPNFVTTK